MNKKKNLHLLLLIGGIVLFFISIYGYSLGIAQREAFGAFQWLGTITGAVVAIVSLFKLIRS